jgi:PAS domain S-box-containing protein
MLKVIIFVLIIFISSISGNSQLLAQNIDSLKNELSISTHDTTSIKLHLSIGRKIQNSSLDSAIYYYEKALKIVDSALAVKSPDKIGQDFYRIYRAKLLRNQGSIQIYKDNYPLALDLIEKAMAIFIEMNDQTGIAKCFNSIGSLYGLQGDYQNALEYYQKSLDIKEQYGDRRGALSGYFNIGSIHCNQANYSKALEYYENANRIAIELNNEYLIATTTTGKGNVYLYQDNYSKALECYKSSLETHKSLDNKRDIGDCINNIGFVYKKMGDYSEALAYFNQALVFQRECGSKRSLVSVMLNVVDCYLNLDDYYKGLEYALESLEISKEINAPILMVNAYNILSTIYERRDNPEDALHYYKLRSATKDSLFNIEKTKALSELEEKYQSEKKEQEIALLKSQTLITELQLNKQTNYRNIAIVGGLLTFIAALLIYIGYLRKQRMNIILGKKVSLRTKKLYASELKYRKLIEQSNDAIYLLKDNRLEIYNEKLLGMLAINDKEVKAEGFDLWNFIAPQHRQLFKIQEAKVKHGEIPSIQYEFNILNSEGESIEVEASISPIDEDSTLGIIRDISERKKLELQLLQAQKMEALGKLAGGIAHDFNNLLTSIIGHAEMVMVKYDLADDIQQSLKEIVRGGERASNLTRQILAFSRKQVMELKITDLNEVITDTEKMLVRTIGEDVKLSTSLDENLWKVKVDPGQIEQVIMNLAVNARDAMPDGGKLMIETSNIDMIDASVETRPELESGSFALVMVSDSGIGMPDEVKENIFDPFFTTKEPGKGTGLGLSTVYGIVGQSGGHIAVYSEPLKGTTFKIYLPKVEGEVDKKEVSHIEEIPVGKEKILLVEDDERVIVIASKVLSSLGYDVVIAMSAEEALIECQKMEDPFDLILTDIVMPNMDGIELVKEVRTFWPEVKVVYMSGYAPNFALDHTEIGANELFLHKPFRSAGIAQKVREVLDRV